MPTGRHAIRVGAVRGSGWARCAAPVGGSGRSGRCAGQEFAAPAGTVRGQGAGVAEGQLIRTLTPELVDHTRTSSARPEITARPKPAGKAIAPSWSRPIRPS